MTRILIAFLAGSLLTCAGAIAADYRTGVMFIAGGIALLILQAAFLASQSRARRFAAFIVAVGDGLDASRQETRQNAPNAQVITDLTSALVNMGMKSQKKAAAIAAEVAQAGGTEADMLRRAMSAARVN